MSASLPCKAVEEGEVTGVWKVLLDFIGTAIISVTAMALAAWALSFRGREKPNQEQAQEPHRGPCGQDLHSEVGVPVLNAGGIKSLLSHEKCSSQTLIAYPVIGVNVSETDISSIRESWRRQVVQIMCDGHQVDPKAVRAAQHNAQSVL